MSNSQVSYRGVDNLQLLFIGLKLTGHITWSWWWILSPIWITTIIFLIIIGITYGTKALIK